MPTRREAPTAPPQLLAAAGGVRQRHAAAQPRPSPGVTSLAAVVLLIGEASELRSGRSPYALIVAYVVLAFLAQAAFGVLLVRTGFLPSWIGWVAIVWNIAWPVVLPIATPGDI